MTADTARLMDAQRRALFAAEAIVNRRLHYFSTRYQSQYSNDVAAERKEIEKEIRTMRRRLPGAPFLSEDLVAAVAEAAGGAATPEQTRAVLSALATLRPDVLSLEDLPPLTGDEDDEEE